MYKGKSTWPPVQMARSPRATLEHYAAERELLNTQRCHWHDDRLAVQHSGKPWPQSDVPLCEDCWTEYREGV